VARCGSRWGRDRHPDSAASRPARRGTILSKAAQRPGERTISRHYRQTQKLLGRDANDLIRREPQHGTVRQQSCRSLTSTDPPKGAANAPIQVCWPSATVSLPPRCRPESFPSRTPFIEFAESPHLAIAILRDLADRDSSLRRRDNNRASRSKTFNASQLDNAVPLALRCYLPPGYLLML